FGPELSLGARLGEIAFEGEHAREDAPDVAVEDRGPLAEAERGDRRRGRAADAGQLRQPRARRRELAAVDGDDDLGAAMKIPRPRVEAQAAPGSEHFAQVGGGKRTDVREAGGEALVV